MSNESVTNMVDSLTSGDNVAAQDAFKSALTDKIGMALDAKRQTVANDWLNAGDDFEAVQTAAELDSATATFDDVAAKVDADAVGTSVTPADDHVDFEIDDDQVVEEE